MSDIVKRLRDLDTATCEDAADEIERLRAQVRKSALDCLAADGQAADLMGEVSKLRAAMQWRPISEAPKDGTRMLLAYRNSLQKWRRVIGFYAPKLTLEQNDDGDGWCEYDEANDRFCLPEGWYECIDNWDDYSYIHIGENKPIHWMLLPPPPAGEPEHE